MTDTATIAELIGIGPSGSANIPFFGAPGVGWH